MTPTQIKIQNALGDWFDACMDAETHPHSMSNQARCDAGEKLSKLLAPDRKDEAQATARRIVDTCVELGLANRDGTMLNLQSLTDKFTDIILGGAK